MSLRRLPLGLVRLVLAVWTVPWLVSVAIVAARKPRRALIWGPVPIINNKYWSEALRAAGWESKTLVHTYYSAINRREDFDLLFDDLVPRFVQPARLRNALAPYAASSYVLRNAGVLHLPFSGGPLWSTPLRRCEAWLLGLARIKTVVIPYGSDAFRYSVVSDPVVRDALLRSAPQMALRERRVRQDVEYWTRNADAIVVGHLMDGLGRWDAAVGNMCCVDTSSWTSRPNYSSADGTNGCVKVLHAPNHRGAKGTQFLLGAVDALRREGLNVELILVERLQNEQLRTVMRERADILADQFLLPGYGIAAIEGMSVGLPVICNLESREHTELFRINSFLDECPIVSASPRTLASVLRALVVHPELRRELGVAGRRFVEKYSSYEAAQYLFEAIYRNLLDGEAVDLRNLFAPWSSEFNRRRARVEHPLLESRLPDRYLEAPSAHRT